MILPTPVILGIVAVCVGGAAYAASALGVRKLLTRDRPPAPRHARRKSWDACSIGDCILCVALTIVILYIIGAW